MSFLSFNITGFMLCLLSAVILFHCRICEVNVRLTAWKSGIFILLFIDFIKTTLLALETLVVNFL